MNIITKNKFSRNQGISMSNRKAFCDVCGIQIDNLLPSYPYNIELCKYCEVEFLHDEVIGVFRVTKRRKE